MFGRQRCWCVSFNAKTTVIIAGFIQKGKEYIASPVTQHELLSGVGLTASQASATEPIELRMRRTRPPSLRTTGCPFKKMGCSTFYDLRLSGLSARIPSWRRAFGFASHSPLPAVVWPGPPISIQGIWGSLSHRKHRNRRNNLANLAPIWLVLCDVYTCLLTIRVCPLQFDY